MLARAADGCFWLARYVERMDNVARLIEAAQSMADMTEGSEEWRSAIVAAGCQDEFYRNHREATPEAALYFLATDRENSSSILNCLAATRTNARAMRTMLTRDMWDAVNGAWLEARCLPPDAFSWERLPETLDWVKTAATRYYGAYETTMLRNEFYYFTRLGTFIERADNTARILDVKYHLLLPRDDGVGGAMDYYQWTSILRAVSAVRGYQWVYKTEVRPWSVAELLLLLPEMPRSTRSSFDAIEAALNGIAASHGGRRGECHRMAGAVAAQLRYGRIEDILKAGLHEYLTNLIDQTARLGTEIARFYMR